MSRAAGEGPAVGPAGQWAADVARMDVLESLVGSGSRADLLTALFVRDPRRWRAYELARAANRPPQNVGRDLEWLIEAGVLRTAPLEGKPSYDLDLASPLVRQLGQFVRQARGRVPEIRHELRRLSLPATAWLIRAAPLGSGGALAARSELIVLSCAPKSVIQLQLARVIEREVRTLPMSVAEWMARLQKGEAVARRARRARKLWVLGSWEELVRLERHYADSKRTLQAARANWREELSDEWDEDWDPFDARVGTG